MCVCVCEWVSVGANMSMCLCLCVLKSYLCGIRVAQDVQFGWHNPVSWHNCVSWHNPVCDTPILYFLSHRVTPSTCCLPTMITIQLVTMISHNINIASPWSSTCLEILWSLHLGKISFSLKLWMKMCVLYIYQWVWLNYRAQKFTLYC